MNGYPSIILLSLGLLFAPILVIQNASAQTSSEPGSEKAYGVLDRDWVERNRAFILRGDLTPFNSSPAALEELELFRADLTQVDSMRWAIVMGTVGVSTIIGTLIPIFVDLEAVDWYWHSGAPAVGAIVGFSLGGVVGEMMAHFIYEGFVEESFNNHVLRAVRIYNNELK